MDKKTNDFNDLLCTLTNKINLNLITINKIQIEHFLYEYSCWRISCSDKLNIFAKMRHSPINRTLESDKVFEFLKPTIGTFINSMHKNGKMKICISLMMDTRCLIGILSRYYMYYTKEGNKILESIKKYKYFKSVLLSKYNYYSVNIDFYTILIFQLKSYNVFKYFEFAKPEDQLLLSNKLKNEFLHRLGNLDAILRGDSRAKSSFIEYNETIRLSVYHCLTIMIMRRLKDQKQMTYGQIMDNLSKFSDIKVSFKYSIDNLDDLIKYKNRCNSGDAVETDFSRVLLVLKNMTETQFLSECISILDESRDNKSKVYNKTYAKQIDLLISNEIIDNNGLAYLNEIISRSSRILFSKKGIW